LTVEKRLQRLEQARGIVDDDEEAPQLVVVWPEDETPETRAAYSKAAAWYKRRGRWPERFRVDWGDGTEAERHE